MRMPSGFDSYQKALCVKIFSMSWKIIYVYFVSLEKALHEMKRNLMYAHTCRLDRIKRYRFTSVVISSCMERRNIKNCLGLGWTDRSQWKIMSIILAKAADKSTEIFVWSHSSHRNKPKTAFHMSKRSKKSYWLIVGKQFHVIQFETIMLLKRKKILLVSHFLNEKIVLAC